jgi:hypothetical protein
LRKSLVGVAITACVVVLALGFTTRLLGLNVGTVEANVPNIRLGMSLQQVEGLLGRPAESKNAYGFVMVRTAERPPKTRKVLAWEGEWIEHRGVASVYFDADDRVISASFKPTTQPSLWDHLGL